MTNIGSVARGVGLLGLALALTGCVAPRPQLYGWGNYQANLYQHFKGEGSDVAAQIASLEAQVVANNVAKRADPPGLHGHLALLYTKTGNDEAARSQLQIERKLFPESAAYVDFLLKKSTQSAQKVEAKNG